MHFYRISFKEQFISILNFGQNYIVQLGWKWFSTCIMNSNAEKKLQNERYFWETVCHCNFLKPLNRISWKFVVIKDIMCRCAYSQEIFIQFFFLDWVMPFLNFIKFGKNERYYWNSLSTQLLWNHSLIDQYHLT